jgi:hypothetical protein
MDDKEDSSVEQFKSKRALLLDYLEHASNVIAKKVTEVAIPERSIKPAKEDKKTAQKKAVVSDSPFAPEASAEPEKVVMEVPIQAPEIVINPSEVDKLLYLRKKRDLLESVLLQDDKKRQDQERSDKPEMTMEAPREMAKTQEVKPVPVEEKVAPLIEPVKPIEEKALEKSIMIANAAAKAEILPPVVKKAEAQIKPETKIKETEKQPDVPKIAKVDNFKLWKLGRTADVEYAWLRRFKKNLRRKGVRRLGRSVRRFAYGSATFALGFYLGYLLLVYSFAPKGPLFEQVAGRLPAPALVSNYGLVDFYSYQQIKSIAASSESDNNPNLMVLKWQIINSLAERYGVDRDLDQDLLLEVLKRKVVGDSSMNYYGARKFIELKQALRRGETIEKVAESTGLAIHRSTYTKKLAAEQFGDLVYGLQANSLSPVIVNDQGIYLLSVLSNSDTKMEFNYLFVPARTLGQLIQEKMADAWIVSLVD